MKKEEVVTPKNAKGMTPIGPYSQAIRLDQLVFCSGNIGIDPKTGILVSGGIKEQTRQALKNIKAVLTAVQTDIDQVVKTTVYLKNMDDFMGMNEIYSTFFSKPYPARATVEVARLPKGAQIEIECIAYINKQDCCGGNGGKCHCEE